MVHAKGLKARQRRFAVHWRSAVLHPRPPFDYSLSMAGRSILQNNRPSARALQNAKADQVRVRMDLTSNEQGSLHYTPEHCLVNCGVPLFWWKKPCLEWATFIF